MISEGLRYAFLCVVGLSSGMIIAGGVFAFLSMIGIIPRLMGRTKTVNRARLYENMVILGGAIGNIVYLYAGEIYQLFWNRGIMSDSFREVVTTLLGTIILILYGLGAGAFVGCLALAIAEGLKVIPIMIGRIHLEKGLPFIILSIALGKACGILIQFSVFAV